MLKKSLVEFTQLMLKFEFFSGYTTANDISAIGIGELFAVYGILNKK